MIRDPETQTLLEEGVRRFVQAVLVPREEEVAETDLIPADIIDQMKELGLFGLSLPDEYGGLGLTMEEEVRIAFELGQTSPAFRSLIGTNNGIGAMGIRSEEPTSELQSLMRTSYAVFLLKKK